MNGKQVGQTSGQHDQKDNRGSRDQVRERGQDEASPRAEMLNDLNRLILAIDRRLPRLLSADEPAIAEDAAELRAKTVQMIARLVSLPV